MTKACASTPGICPFCEGYVCPPCGISLCKGPRGREGKGVPKGGEEGQVLTKLTDENYDTYWASIIPISGGGSGGIFDLGERLTGSELFDGGARV